MNTKHVPAYENVNLSLVGALTNMELRGIAIIIGDDFLLCLLPLS